MPKTTIKKAIEQEAEKRLCVKNNEIAVLKAQLDEKIKSSGNNGVVQEEVKKLQDKLSEEQKEKADLENKLKTLEHTPEQVKSLERKLSIIKQAKDSPDMAIHIRRTQTQMNQLKEQYDEILRIEKELRDKEIKRLSLENDELKKSMLVLQTKFTLQENIRKIKRTEKLIKNKVTQDKWERMSRGGSSDPQNNIRRLARSAKATVTTARLDPIEKSTGRRTHSSKGKKQRGKKSKKSVRKL